MLFRLSDILRAWVFRKIKNSKYDIYFILTIISLLSVLIKIVSHIYIFVATITFLVILIAIYSNNLEYFLRKNIDSKVLGIITSINSIISCIFSFLALATCSVLTNFLSAINNICFINTYFFVHYLLLWCINLEIIEKAEK